MIEVVDNAIPEYLQEFYEMAILGKSNGKRIKPLIDFHCKYEKTSPLFGDATPISFVHLLKTANETSTHFANFYQIIDIFSKQAQVQVSEVYTGRIYITTPLTTEASHYNPHIDLNFPHTVLLYYVNDADGNTVFFDNSGNIIKEVEPKRGRLVIFDGSIYHAAGIPKKSHRSVVNFDIKVSS